MLLMLKGTGSEAARITWIQLSILFPKLSNPRHLPSGGRRLQPRGDRKKSESRDERTTNLHANPSKICSDIRFTMGDSLHRYA